MNMRVKLLKEFARLDQMAQGVRKEMVGRSSIEAIRLDQVCASLISDHARYRLRMEESAPVEEPLSPPIIPLEQTFIEWPTPEKDSPAAEAEKREPKAKTESPIRKHAFVPFYPSRIRNLDRAIRARNSGLGIGDVLFGLAPFKSVGGGEFYITCFNPAFNWAESHPYSDAEYRHRTYHNLATYIQSQSYITISVAKSYDNDEEFDIDFDNVRHHWNRCITENIGQLEVYHDYLGSNADLSGRWLDAPSVKDPDLENAVLINVNDRRTCEHLDFRVLEDVDNLIFVGLQREYDYFCSRYRMQPEFRLAKDFFELATWLASCKVFIGCSSMIIVMADGLNSNRIFCQWPTRPYFRTYGGNTATVLTQEGFTDALYKFGVLA